MTGPQAVEVLSVALIDDSQNLRNVARFSLERSGGFRVVAEAANGAAALEVLHEHQPDVILLNVSMPVMDGLEALPLIRRARPEAVIVVYSGHARAQYAQRAYTLGADAYVEKGATPKDLIPQLHDLVRQKRG